MERQVEPRRPVAASAARPWRLALYPAAWVAAAVAGLAIGTAFRIERAVTPGDLDHRVWHWVVNHREAHPIATRFWLAASRVGDGDVATPVVLAVAVALGLSGGGRRRDGVVFAMLMLAAKLLSMALKAYFGRARPDELFRLVVEDSASFPSGHALTSSAFCVGLIGLLADRVRGWPGWPRGMLLGLLALAPGLIAASRVWLAVHYLSDVLAGLVLGSSWAWAVVAIHRGYGPRRGAGRASAEGSGG